MNVTLEASETEIKKQFRELARIYHPDKNDGSKNAEETFKIILNAYETLSNSEKRAIYDQKYKQHFQQRNKESLNQNKSKSNTNKEATKQSTVIIKDYQKDEKTRSKMNYWFWVIIVLLTLLYFNNSSKTKTMGNKNANHQFEEQKSESRPQTGEIDFNK
jgi:curved DNA-binding protein CbpA